MLMRCYSVLCACCLIPYGYGYSITLPTKNRANLFAAAKENLSIDDDWIHAQVCEYLCFCISKTVQSLKCYTFNNLPAHRHCLVYQHHTDVKLMGHCQSRLRENYMACLSSNSWWYCANVIYIIHGHHSHRNRKSWHS